MKGLIMAGGEGTRLRPLTCGKPKPMLEVMGVPVMEHIIRNLKAAGITEIAVTLMYLPRNITEYFGDGSRFGVSLHYYTENMPLGTAGSVKNAQSFLDDEFVIISGDCLTDMDVSKAIDYHQKKKALVTLVLKQVCAPEEYGLVVTDEDGRITRFVEKPSAVEVLSDAANTGIYVVNPSLLDFIEPGQACDFSKDVFPLLLSKKLPMYGYLMDGYWCDIGDLLAYRQCHFDILNGKVRVPLAAEERWPGVYVEPGASIAQGARLFGPCYIGRNSVIHHNAHIMPYAVLGANCRVAEGASIKHSVLHHLVTVSSGAQLRGCIAAAETHIGAGAVVLENAVIGERTRLGEYSEVKNNIKIWPDKVVEKESIVAENLVWGNTCSNQLFGETGVSGQLNVDVTPEFAARLGAACGALYQNGKVAVSSEHKSSLVMLKNALLAGLMSTGVDTIDLGALPLPVMRKAVPFYGQQAGVHIDAVEQDGQLRPVITFCDQAGADISRQQERKLETLFARQDFVRCEAENVKMPTKVYDFNTYYNNELLLEFRGTSAFAPLHLTGNTGLFYALLHQMGVKLVSNPDGVVSARVSENGQHVALADEKGRLISDDLYFVMVCYMLMKDGATTIVAPLTASSSIEQMAKEQGAKVVRCKTGKSAMMSAMLEHNATAQFRMLYDGCYALAKIASFLGRHGVPLYRLIDEFPDIYMVQREVKCDSEKIGAVMQAFSSRHEPTSSSPEGVRIVTENGWVVLLPHADKKRFRIISEGFSEEFANELCDFYEAEISSLTK